MLKTLSLVVAGLVAGLALAFWLQPSSEPGVAAAAPGDGPSFAVGSTSADTVSAGRIAALEDALDAEILQRSALEDRVVELAAQLEALGQNPVRAARAGQGAGNGPDPAVVEQRARVRREAAATPEERQRLIIDRLIAAGFAPDRAEWINRRTQELRMQAMQAEYEARREGRPAPSGDLEATTLRAELGEQDYERFLTAQGRSTSVNITGVLASSPAERAGLQPGDEIVSYDGKRVFDIGELNELTLGGTSGESVVVDVRRNGQNLQIVLPRGPIGVWGGFRGPPVPLGR
jgi:PDZ domain-containing protein